MLKHLKLINNANNNDFYHLCFLPLRFKTGIVINKPCKNNLINKPLLYIFVLFYLLMMIHHCFSTYTL